jgi:NAD+ kinase
MPSSTRSSRALTSSPLRISDVRIGAIALYFNPEKAQSVETARRIAGMVGGRDIKVGVCEGDPDVLRLPVTCAPEAADVLISIGGDGTLLRAARVAHPLGIPLLGVNTGRLGFLTEVEADEEGYAALDEFFDREPVVEERVALHAQVSGSTKKHFAINEVVVRRGAQARLAPFGLSLDGEVISHLPSDGVIVSTPAGSTGYFLSAGGPIMHPTVDALGVAGLMPHTLFARPLIVPSNATIEITCDGETALANLETDGIIGADLHGGDRVVITKATTPIRFARVRPHAFFARLEDKLRWGAPITP